nr:10160_t:CDS:2 [Entrophospora candida]
MVHVLYDMHFQLEDQAEVKKKYSSRQFRIQFFRELSSPENKQGGSSRV